MMLKELCRDYTGLNQDDIEILLRIGDMLPYIAELTGTDVFIDCITRDPNVAVVVAQGTPKTQQSLYSVSVVGKLALRQNEPAALRSLEIGMETRDLKAITQEGRSVRQNVVPIKNEQNRSIGVLIMEQDVTDDVNQNAHMEILSETAAQLTQTLLDAKDEWEGTVTSHLNDAIIVYDGAGVATYANPAAQELYRKLGYRDEIIGMHFDNMAFNQVPLRQVIDGQSFSISEVEIGKLSLQVKYAAKKIKGNNAGIVMLAKDVTDVREKEKELILKSVAMREIHHRVKNNLQTIASLLRLQSRRIADPEAKSCFKDSINRILSMAVTHEILAQNGMDDVDIMTILQKLKESTFSCDAEAGRRIRLQIKGDRFQVGSDEATSIALVINELIQNSLEHAFPDRDIGKIDVIIQKGIMYSSISIADDGIGFDPEHIGAGSLGLTIVKGIVMDKLGGTLHIESGASGTKIAFDFRNGSKTV